MLLAQYPDSTPVDVLQYQRVGTRVPTCEDWSTDVRGLATKQGELGESLWKAPRPLRGGEEQSEGWGKTSSALVTLPRPSATSPLKWEENIYSAYFLSPLWEHPRTFHVMLRNNTCTYWQQPM